jgi:hypothetical protein
MNCWLLIILSAFCTVNALPKIDSLLQAMDYSYSMDIDVKARVRIPSRKAVREQKKWRCFIIAGMHPILFL